MDFVYFLGRFHVLALHLPIGILFAAIGLDIWRHFKNDPSLERPALILWGLGALSAILTVILGWMHSLEGGFEGAGVAKHQWFGISVALIACAIWLVRCKILLAPRWDLLGGAVTFILLTITGHYGGNLTHGETYLVEYAPGPIRQLAGLSSEQTPRPPVKDLASAEVFLDIVYPGIKQRCVSCHNESKRRGQYSVQDYALLVSGGVSGPAIEPGSLERSELYRRISLPMSHEDFMPADGKTPLSDDEVAAIAWWIENGAPSGARVSDFEISPETEIIFSRIVGLDEASITGTPQAERPSQDLIDALKSRAFEVRFTDQESGFLDVDGTVRGGELTQDDMSALCAVSDNIASLSLKGMSLERAFRAQTCASFDALTSLNLAGTDISDEAFVELPNMPALRVLVLHSTSLNPRSVDALARYPNLEAVYVWNSDMRPSLDSAQSFEFELVGASAPPLAD